MDSSGLYTDRQAGLYLGTLMALPFVVFAGGLYRVFLLHRAILLSHTSLILLAVIVVSVPVHELLHGLGWKLAGRLEKDKIKFLFQHGMPMCACRAVLSARDYLIGVSLPFLVLGRRYGFYDCVSGHGLSADGMGQSAALRC